MSGSDFDVAIVGYGPVASVLAIMLGRQGRRVVIFERWTERYNLPRAVCVDHEMYRMLSAIGLGEALPSVSHPTPPLYQWYNANWQELLRIDWSAEAISGGPETHFVHQPTLESMFDAQVRAQPGIEVHLGWEVVSVAQDPASASLVAENRETGERRTVSARYLVGCDGANSVVRQAIGGEQEDRGFEADWLVIDILPNEDADLDLPPAAQWCNPLRPTTIVPAGVKDGRYYRRWEFMRLPSETVEELESEESAWRLLAPWVRPDQATMVRHKVYTFRSLLALTWRDGRLLIAGDAAHVMPPFMGQGMCAGFRDAWNLSWKLDLVLDGNAEADLLDLYQVERMPHVSDYIEISMFLGRVICIADPEEAAQRDAAFLSGHAPPPPPSPHLTAGLIHTAAPGEPDVAGLLSPHGNVRRGGVEGRFDDLVGAGQFVLIANSSAVIDALPPDARRILDDLNVTQVVIDGPDGDGRWLSDLQGRYTGFLANNGLAALLVRPDFFVYGGARTSQALAGMIEALPAGLHLRQPVAVLT